MPTEGRCSCPQSEAYRAALERIAMEPLSRPEMRDIAREALALEEFPDA